MVKQKKVGAMVSYSRWFFGRQIFLGPKSFILVNWKNKIMEKYTNGSNKVQEEFEENVKTL